MIAKTCVCCQRKKDDARPRVPNNPRPLCDACWDDPANLMADCRHGGQ